MQMPNTEHLQEKWAPVLDYEGMDPIKDSHRRAVTAVLLENQEQTLREERDFLSEGPTVSTNTSGSANAGFSAGASTPVAGFDPVLISLIRRAMPNLVAYDLAGVQPMSGPTGLIFAMRSRYTTRLVPRHCSTKQIPHSADNPLTSTTPMVSTNGAVGMGTTHRAAATLVSSTLKVPKHTTPTT